MSSGGGDTDHSVRCFLREVEGMSVWVVGSCWSRVVFWIVNVSEWDCWIQNFPRLLRLLRLSPSRDHLMAGKKKSSLQTALLKQQSRLKQKSQIAQAAKSSEKAKAAKKQTVKKAVTIPFSPTDRILLIGEGNFSFAYALVVNPPSQLQHLPPQNITATAYDTEEGCLAKYPDAREKVNALRAKGVNLLFGVDATKLEKVPQLKGKCWDRVVWNFPHAGKCRLDLHVNQGG